MNIVYTEIHNVDIFAKETIINIQVGWLFKKIRNEMLKISYSVLYFIKRIQMSNF